MFKNLSASALGISGHESEIIELALTFGFSAMDLAVSDFTTRAKIHGMGYATRLIESAKIRLGLFKLPFGWDTEDEQFKKDVKRLPEYAEAAAEVGCTRCVATLAPAGDKLPYHENFEFHRHRFSEICGALHPAGISFGAGFQAAEYLRRDAAFQFIHDLDALTLLLNMVDAPNMGLVLDAWDLVVGGGSVETIRNLPLEQIVAVQVAELPDNVHMEELDENSRLLPDAENGKIGIADVLKTLAEVGYDGPVTVKASRIAFENKRRDAVVRRVGQSLNKVWQKAGLTPEGKLAPPPEPAETVEG